MNGLLGVIALLVLLTLGVPIGVSMGVVGHGRPHAVVGPGARHHQIRCRAVRDDHPLRAGRAAAVSIHGARLLRGRCES